MRSYKPEKDFPYPKIPIQKMDEGVRPNIIALFKVSLFRTTPSCGRDTLPKGLASIGITYLRFDQYH